MEKKFELTDEKIMNSYEPILYRIRALKDFGNVKKGELGGFVEKEKNLSQEGNCWIYHNAKVYDNAIVVGNAKVWGNARVVDNVIICGNAKIYGNAILYSKTSVGDNAEVCDDANVYDNTKITGNAIVCDNATVCGHAIVYGNARVGGNAIVYGNARVGGNAIVYGNARVGGNATVYDDANVCGDARITDSAVIKEEQRIELGHCTVDLSKNLKENIRLQTNLFPQKDYVIAYKQVRKDLTSFYDNNFQYKIGEWVEVENPNMSTTESCASGLHFSNVNYGDCFVDSATYLMAKIMYDDIIAIQDGKIRCKRAFIIDKYEIEDN